MPAATIETTLEVAGIELDVELEIEGNYADHGIGSYEYWGARGTHHEWGWTDVELEHLSYDPGDIPFALRQWQPHLSRKQFRKAVRRLRRRVETLINGAAENWVEQNEDKCIEALAAQNEPEYDEDRPRRRRYFSVAA
jgi:hypothetical protein